MKARWWKHDTESLERAKAADAEATKHLRKAKETGRWVDRTLEVNNLTQDFFRGLGLHHGGNT